MNIKELAEKIQKQQRFISGHRTCSGCGIPLIVRTVLAAADDPVVAANATGCLEVTTSIYPFTSWNIPWIHSAFENAAATISGAEAAYKALKKKGAINKLVKFVAFGGDGGTYDIGLQSLSGAWERGHDFVYVCYDNEAYMNTGNQRSSSTPYGAETSTTPAGKVRHGKEERKKDLVKIALAHNIPYVAQAAVHNLNDLFAKAQKAFQTKGPALLNVLMPCTLNWKFPTSQTTAISKLAVETRVWPLYEVENSKYKINYKPAEPKPVGEYLKTQGRFRHLFAPENTPAGEAGLAVIGQIQERADRDWEELLAREK